MNRPGSGRLAETVSSAASMTLFLIFSVCCLIIIAVAASAYGRISGNYDSTFSSAAAVRYITNKLRACESADIVSEGELLLRGDGCVTLIYFDGEAVCERLFAEGDETVSSGGEKMFEAEMLTVENADGLIKVTAGDSGHSFTTYCRNREK